VCLGIVDHLQLVLHVAQKQICTMERRKLLVAQQGFSTQRNEGPQGIAIEYLRHPAAMHCLNGLDDKFDFTNAAGSQLHISIRLSACRDLPIQPRFHIAHVGEGFQIERRIKNEWP